MKTIQIISLQNELGMSIGLHLNLKEMLKEFTKVCIRQMGLSSVHYYILQDEEGNTVLPEANKTYEIKHLISIPERSKSNHGYNFSSALKMIHEHEFTKISYQENKNTNEHIYYLPLEGIGVISLHRSSRPLEDIILNLLTPILKRLRVSCLACIQYEHLLHQIEATKKAEEKIRYQAFHDELTGLPNRRMFIEYLKKDMSRSERHGFWGAVLFLDLNRFKAINDSLGHAAGDQLLIAVSKILKNIIRKEDTVSRFSGDEFVIQFSKIGVVKPEAIKAIKSVLHKIHQEFSNPIKADNHTLNITPSIGVEIYPNGDLTADDILHNADTAMYHAKSQGPNNSFFYDEKLSLDLIFRLELEKELQSAIKDTDQFELVYQPQYATNNTCIGAEALIRWKNPSRGYVSPAQFIPIAEETGLMLDIGRWVLLQACRDLKVLKEDGFPDNFKSISINVSAIQLSRENFADELLEIVRENSVPENMLSIELTESALIKDVNEIIGIISKLRKNGIKTSVDDFGTGYSSLSYLSQLPIETLKIDQAFVRNIHSDNSSRAIVIAIIALGKSLNLNIISEGVETDEELHCLKGLGCENFQGFYFSRPIPFEALRTLIFNCNN